MKLFLFLIPFFVGCNSSTFGGRGDSKNTAAQSPATSHDAQAQADSLQNAEVVITAIPSEGVPDAQAPSALPADEISDPRNQVAGEGLVQPEVAKPPLDIIWVVDNSPSMQNTTSTLGALIHKFSESLSQSKDVRIAVLARKGNARTEVQTTDDKSITAFDVWVASTNPLAIAASAICRDNQTALKSPSIFGPVNPNDATICGVDVMGKTMLGNRVLEIEDRERVVGVRGMLNQWIRNDAKHAFVFVSDENSVGVDENQFLQMVSTRMSDVPKVFAFTGLTGKSTCKTFGMGSVYERLAAKTGGEAFDYCSIDWAPLFAKIAAKL